MKKNIILNFNLISNIQIIFNNYYKLFKNTNHNKILKFIKKIFKLFLSKLSPIYKIH